MKKANFSLVITAMVFFMFLGVQSFAQTNELNNPLSTTKVMSTNGVSLVSDIEAIDILSAEYKDVLSNIEDYTATANLEAKTATKLEYMKYLIQEISAGSGVKASLENSANFLTQAVSKYKAGLLDPETVYLETRALLEL